MTKSSEQAYKNILKTTSIFGGVQVVNILFSIIRSKAAVFFLGATGIGVVGLLTSVFNIINQVTKLGVDVTAVKEIAYADNQNDSETLHKVVLVIRRLVWITGVLGSVITVLFSSVLSKLTFGDTSYTWAFIVLALAVLVKQLEAGQLAVIQGLKRYRILAAVNVLSSLVSVIVTVFCYYMYGVQSIVYVILLITIAGYGISYFASKNIVSVSKIQSLDFKTFKTESKSLITLGFYLSLVGVIALLGTYMFQVFLRTEASVAEVGYYHAAFIILNTYAGMVFNALGTDYFPRLSAVHNQNDQVEHLVNQQALITTLLITPIVIVFIVFSPIVLQILYDKTFVAISSLLAWAMLGLLFKSASFSIGYVLLAKNDSNMFLKTSLIFNSLLLLVQIVGYKIYGIEGIGIAYAGYFLIHFLGLSVVVLKRYNLKLQPSYYKVLIVCLVFALATVFVFKCYSGVLKYILYAVLVVLTFVYIYKQFNRLIDVKSTVVNKLKRFF